MASKPANPDTYSFLDLPPEIRNYVYRIWFNEEPAQLFEFEAGHLALVQYLAADKLAEAEYYYKLLRRATHGSSLAKPRRISHQALNVLRSCRQLHYEATPMLYSGKIFIHAPRRKHHDARGQYINSMPVAWLNQTGYHSSFVRKIVIDVAAVGPRGCICRGPDQLDMFRKIDGYLHIGNIVDAIWTRNAGLDIEFTDTGPLPSFCSVGNTSYLMPQSSVCHAKRLSRVVRQLGRDDLGMKKFRRAIADIGIRPDGSAGVFIFRTTDSYTNLRYQELAFPAARNPVFDHARFFQVNADGSVRFSDQQSSNPKGLFGLPQKVLEQIADHVLCPNIVHEIDLGSDTNFSSLYGIFHVHRRLRNESFISFLRTRQFNISIISLKTHGGFPTTKLKRLLQTRFRRRDIYGTSRTTYFGRDVDYFISLHTYPDQRTSEDPGVVEVNITPLIKATFASEGGENIHILVHYGDGTVKKYRITVDELRHSALKVLEVYVKEKHATDAGVLCPELWMDAHGKKIQAVSTGSGSLPGGRDPAEEYSMLWHARKLGRDHGNAPHRPEIDGLARSMYLYLKWVVA